MLEHDARQVAGHEGLTISPARVEVLPGEVLDVSVAGAGPVRVELGYLEILSDEHAGSDGAGWGMPDGATTWVEVASTTVDAVAGGCDVALEVPEDAPPSCHTLARWAVRASGDGTLAEAAVRVLAPAPQGGLDRLEWEREGPRLYRLDLKVPSAGAPIGGTLTGHVRLAGDEGAAFKEISIALYRERRGAAGAARSCKEFVPLARGMVLRGGHPRQLPFELPIPADCEPTARATSGAIRWWVQAWAWRGWQGPDGPKVRREVILFNGP